MLLGCQFVPCFLCVSGSLVMLGPVCLLCAMLGSLVVSDSFSIPWTVARLLCPWNFPGKNTGVGLPFSSPGDLPDPGIEPASLMSPALAGGFFTTRATWDDHESCGGE